MADDLSIYHSNAPAFPKSPLRHDAAGTPPPAPDPPDPPEIEQPTPPAHQTMGRPLPSPLSCKLPVW
jgi:hypothetical protein